MNSRWLEAHDSVAQHLRCLHPFVQGAWRQAAEWIDGISALISALGRALLRRDTERSVYEERGILVF